MLIRIERCRCQLLRNMPRQTHIGTFTTLLRLDIIIIARYNPQELLLARNVSKYRSICYPLSKIPTKERHPSTTLKPVVSLRGTSTPFNRIGIDLLGRFQNSAHGNRKSSFVQMTWHIMNKKSLPTAETEEVVILLLKESVLRHGSPPVIITNVGPSSTSD